MKSINSIKIAGDKKKKNYKIKIVIPQSEFQRQNKIGILKRLDEMVHYISDTIYAADKA
jgi:hypothetical protein